MSGIGYAALRITTIVFSVYVGLCMVVYFRQASYVYYPSKIVDATPESMNADYDDVRLKAEDGVEIAGWFVRSGKDWRDRNTVLICHGNGGNIAGRLGHIETFVNMGMNTMLFDYRGYGNSGGSPSEDGTYRDAMASWKYLTGELKLPAGSIILYGESLGGAVAAWLAEQVAPGALILDSTFTSAPDMGATMFPFLPTRLLCKFKYDTLSRMPAIRCPVIVAHSLNDEMISFMNGERLFKAAMPPKHFVKMKGSHNDGGILSAPAYMDAVRTFLAVNLRSEAAGK